MPIFEYTCQECSQRFEELTLTSKQTAPHCPHCGGAKVEKAISVFAAKSSGDAPGSFSESDAPICGACGGPGPCAIN